MVIGTGHFMAPWIVCCTYLYISQWVDGCKGYLVYISHIPQYWQIQNQNIKFGYLYYK